MGENINNDKEAEEYTSGQKETEDGAITVTKMEANKLFTRLGYLGAGIGLIYSVLLLINSMSVSFGFNYIHHPTGTLEPTVNYSSYLLNIFFAALIGSIFALVLVNHLSSPVVNYNNFPGLSRTNVFVNYTNLPLNKIKNKKRAICYGLITIGIFELILVWYVFVTTLHYVSTISIGASLLYIPYMLVAVIGFLGFALLIGSSLLIVVSKPR